ncbi:hypothetical protein MY1884_005726 [Beauveria asiatica]
MKLCPFISLPYRPQEPGRRLWLYALRFALVQTLVEDTHGRCVDLAPWPLQIQPSGLVDFADNPHRTVKHGPGDELKISHRLSRNAYRDALEPGGM